MPAWGVRTALTALRSFMAEQGSAGQVGGLEASADVRKRLARESRNWRCAGCAKSNEEIMREWWGLCAEKGVKVEEDMGLDSLPEGMSLEARDPTAGQEGEPAATASQKQQDRMTEHQETPQLPSTVRSPAPSSELQPQLSTNLHAPAQPISTSHTPSQPRFTPRSRTLPPEVRLTAEPAPTITIDRAIGVVFLALCLMILKKIFYPASSSGMDDFYLQHD